MCSLLISRTRIPVARFVLPFGFERRGLSSWALRTNAEKSGVWSLTPPSKRTTWCIQAQTGGSEPEVVTRIKVLGKSHRWNDVLAEFRKSQQTTTIYNVTISAAQRCGKYSEGLELFTAMRENNVVKSASTFTAAMAIHSHLGNAAEVRSLLDELLTLWESPLPLAFTPLMNVKAVVGDVAGVYSAFEEMAKYGISPDAAHYGCLLKACRNAADLDMAMQVLTDMRQAGRSVTVIDYTLAMGTIRTSAVALASLDLAQKHIHNLVAWMAEDGVAANTYFMEEHIAAQLGQDLSSACISRLQREQAIAVANAALRDIKSYEQSGLRLTKMTRRTAEMLRQFVESMVSSTTHATTSTTESKQLPAGWGSAVDPVSGTTYYYNAAGISQWERPNERS